MNCNIDNIIILTTHYIDNIALSLYNIISKLINIKINIQYTLSEEECNKSTLNTLYIILYSNELHNKMPKRYVLFQLEQLKSNHFNDKRISQIIGSEVVWEFSIINSIKYIEKINNNKIFFTPNPYYQIYDNKYYDFDDCVYDILFYGTLSDRRLQIINKLRKKYKVFFKPQLFGEEKEECIKKSKIIINLHYYDFACLETGRINECLQYNKVILSENTKNTNYFSDTLYDDLIIYFDEIKDDLSNINKLYEKIDYYLIRENYNMFVNNINKSNLIEKSVYYIHRNLLSIVGLNVSQSLQYNIPNNNDIYCITSVENPINFINFKKQKNVPSNIHYFPQIKYCNDWLSYGLNLKTIINSAKKNDLEYIIICDNMCQFPLEYNIIDNILEFLNRYNIWDIYTGAIENLPIDTHIKDVIVYKDTKYINIDTISYGAFNIYNKSVFDIISEWDQSYGNINEYITNKKLNIIISEYFPFNYIGLYDRIYTNKSDRRYEYISNISYSSNILKLLINNYKNRPTIII